MQPLLDISLASKQFQEIPSEFCQFYCAFYCVRYYKLLLVIIQFIFVINYINPYIPGSGILTEAVSVPQSSQLHCTTYRFHQRNVFDTKILYRKIFFQEGVLLPLVGQICFGKSRRRLSVLTYPLLSVNTFTADDVGK